MRIWVTEATTLIEEDTGATACEATEGTAMATAMATPNTGVGVVVVMVDGRG